MICPVCQGDADPLVKVRSLVICGVCGASLHIDDDGTARPSRFSDVEALELAEMAQLRRARASIVRPGRTL